MAWLTGSPRPKSCRLYAAYLIFCAIPLLFSACSGNQFAYNHLDRIIPWYVNDYISLNKDQKRLFRAILDKKLMWHRKTQLPQYARILDTIRQNVGKPLTHAQVAAYYSAYKSMWNKLLIEFIPDISTMLSLASDTQVNQLLLRLRNQNETLRQQYVLPAPQDIIQIRANSTMDQLKHWIKYLTPEQKKSVVTWSTQLLPVNEHWLYYRMLWLQRFKLALQHRDTNTGLEKRLQALFLHPSQFWSPDYASAVQYNENQTMDFYARLFSDLERDQKTYFLHKLDKLREDLRQLAREV